MSAQALQEDQLLELLLQLKKTTPDQARTILQTQPQIAFALMAVMVNINAVNMEVVQRTLAAYGAVPGAAPVPAPTPAPAIPPHLIPQAPRGGTPTYPPQSQLPAYPHSAYPPHAGPSHNHNPYGVQSAPLPGFVAQTQVVPAPVAAPTSIIPDALASIPDEQKALIMRVISMTREEIYQLPYSERDSIIKLRATLGLPT